MNTTYNNRRSTVFLSSPLNFTEELLSKYISEFSSLGLLPTVNKGLGIKLSSKGIEPEEVISLDLKKLDETLKVSFGPDRVDVVSTKIDETWDKFCEITLQISDVLLKLGKNFNRLALCASVKFRLNDGLGESAYSNLIGKSEEKPVEWQIRKVNRYSLQASEDTKAVVNDVQTISRNNIIVNDEDLKDVIILDLDLNTLVGTESEVIQSIRKPFWHAASMQIQKDISQYQTEFEQWQ